MADKKKTSTDNTKYTKLDSEIGVSKKTELSFPVSSAQAKAIQNCLKNGELKISISDIDLEKGGRFKGAYLYD